MRQDSTRLVSEVLQPEPPAAARARRSVIVALDAWDLGHLTDEATLLTSELVTNAALHAGTPMTLLVHRRDGGIRVEVHDDNHSFPSLPQDQAEAPHESGRGLWLVNRVADRWGTAPSDRAKCVWFELDAVAP